MDAYRLVVLAHIFVGIVLVGLSLYWFIMLAALRQKFSASETAGYLDVAAAARWPHVAVPWKLRIPLRFMGWFVIALAVGTGVALLQFRPAPERLAWWLKLGLLGATIVAQLWLTLRPTALAIRLNMALVLGILFAASWAIR